MRRYTPLWIEAFAYHESGHVVMGLVLGVPISHVSIAEACDLPGRNGVTEYADLAGVSRRNYALMLLASEPAERMAPNFGRFRNLRGFSAGRRNDKAQAFNSMATVYQIVGYAESTARQAFREHTGPPLALIMRQTENQRTVHEVARILIANKQMDSGAIEVFKNLVVTPDGINPRP